MTSIVRGVVIGARDYKETDRLYTLYTKERGKVTILGKGTRKFQSKLAPHMTPFTECTFMLAHGRYWLRLGSVERLHDYRRIREDIALYGLGLGMNELAKQTIGDAEPDDDLYQFLINAYDWIRTLPESSEHRYRFIYGALMLKWFVFIGIGPHCEACVSCQTPIREMEAMAMSVVHGGVVCATCWRRDRVTFSDAIPVTEEVIAALRFLTHAPFESLLTSGFEPLLDELTTIYDGFRHYYVERDLKVPNFLEGLVRQPQ